MLNSPTAVIITLPTSIRVLMPDGQVEEMKLEMYLAGVVAAEIGATAPLEALKAQAVASRTYVAAEQRHREHNADVCTTAHCQKWKRVAPVSAPEVFRALSETWGLIAVYDGQPISAFFFEHCDGRTRNSEEMLMPTMPYLRGVHCSCGHLTLKGHGVGMCKRGAIVMARRGASFQQILQHYYRGVVITNTAVEPQPSVSVAPLLAVESPKPRPRAKKMPAPPPAPKPVKRVRRKRAPRPAVERRPTTDDRRQAVIEATVEPREPIAIEPTVEVAAEPREPIAIEPTVEVTTEPREPIAIEPAVEMAAEPREPIAIEPAVEMVAEPREPIAIEPAVEVAAEPREPTPIAPAGAPITPPPIVAESELPALEQIPARAARAMHVDFLPGQRMIAGCLPRPGAIVTIEDTRGNKTLVFSGSAAHYGIGGFETIVDEDGLYRVTIDGQVVEVNVSGETAFIHAG